MDVLIAEDDAVSRKLLEATLTRLGYRVRAYEDGGQAWGALQKPDAPRLAVLDWMMPEMDGVEVCKRVRKHDQPGYRYLILLTSRGQKQDVIAGLDSGADDYVTKPFDPDELHSRLRTGERILNLEAALASKVAELEEALAHVKQLQGLLPICMHCKKIRDDTDTWHRLETYISDHSQAMFTHSLCQDCIQKHYGKDLARAKDKRDKTAG